MTITEQEYKDKKEYWDYQRKVEYNKEKLKNRINQYSTTEWGEEILFNSVWSNLEDKDYEEPTKGWIPINNDYRLWNESKPNEFNNSFNSLNELQKPKGRKVILRAKEK